MVSLNGWLEKLFKLHTGWATWLEQPRGRWIAGVVIACLGLGSTAFYAHHLNGFYAVRDWFFWPIALLWLYNIVLFASFWCAGHLVVVKLMRLDSLSTIETAVLSVAVGVVAFGMVMYLLGFLGLFNLAAAILLPIACIAPSIHGCIAFYRRRTYRKEAPLAELGRVERVLAGLATGFGTICLLIVYLPLIHPDSINFDAAWCHLTISQDYANAGRIIPFDADHARNIIQFAPLIHTWGWLLPMPGLTQRWTMPLHTEFFFLLWTLVGIAAAARYLLGNERHPRLWVVFFLFPAIFVYDMNLGGAADHMAAFFAPPLLLVSLRALKTMDRRFLILCGALAGALLLTKYQGGYLLAACFLVLCGAWFYHLWRYFARRSEAILTLKTLLVNGGLGLVAFVAVIAPHFGRNWVFHGNPVYPFAQDIFNSTPTVKNAVFLVEYIHKDWRFRPHGTLFENIVDAFKLFGTFALEPHYTFTKGWPTFGALFTFTLPMLLLVRRSGRIWLAAIVSWGALMMWAMTFRVDRNLQIFSPVLIITTAAVLVRVWQTGWIARIGLIPLVALQIVWGGDMMIYNRKSFIITSMELISSGFNGKLEHRDRFREKYKRLNKDLPPDAKVIRHQFRRNLGILRDMPMDWPGAQDKYSYDHLHSLAALRKYYRKHGITHLLHMPNKRPAWNMHDEILFEDFIRFYPKKRYENLELVTLNDAPLPERTPPYEVVTIGVTGYRDGVYRLKQLLVQERLPKHLRKYPKPKIRRLNRRDDNQVIDAINAARAVLIHPKQIRPAIKKALGNGFERVRKYNHLAVYLTRP